MKNKTLLTLFAILVYTLGLSTPSISTMLHGNPASAMVMPSTGLLFAPHSASCARTKDFHYCVDINDWGFRGANPVKDTRCRVAIVGSSYVYGAGVYDEQTWPALLENERIQSFNLGQPSATFYDLYETAHKAKTMLDYDVLIVGILPAFDDNIMGWSGRIDGHNLKMVKEMISRFKSLDVPFSFVILPDSHYLDEQYQPIVSEVTKDGASASIINMDDQWYFPHDRHYTVEGNRHVAEQVKPVIDRLCKKG